jgi:hypothetical protein
VSPMSNINRNISYYILFENQLKIGQLL